MVACKSLSCVVAWENPSQPLVPLPLNPLPVAQRVSEPQPPLAPLILPAALSRSATSERIRVATLFRVSRCTVICPPPLTSGAVHVCGSTGFRRALLPLTVGDGAPSL